MNHNFGLPGLVFLGLFLLLAAILAPATTGLAQDGKGISKYGGLFLTIPAEARQVGMGGAFTGIADDVNTMRYNIGGLGNLRKIMLSANYHNWIDDTRQSSIGIVFPGKLGVLGASVTYFDEGSIAEINEHFVPTGFGLESDDVALQLAYGTFFRLGENQNLGLGLGVKFIRQNLVGETATAFGLDLGLHYIYKRLSLGATIQNIGLSRLQFDQQKEQLPMIYRGGAGLLLKKARNFKLSLAGDIAYTASQALRYYTGAEIFTLNDVIALRAGYKIHDTEASRWGVGAGINIPLQWLANSIMRFDYTYSPMEFLNMDTHIISFVFTFGVTQPVQPIIPTYDARELEDLNARLKQQLEEAKLREKRLAEAEARAKALEDSLRARLERIKDIAAESEGKIEVKETVPGEEILVTMRITFDFDKANIRTDEYTTMHQVGQILNTYPDASVFLSGHTDWIGPEEYNIQLSQRRVDSVLVFLVGKEKVTKERFYWPIGYGELYPVDDNTTSDGRARNRRVEFLLFTSNKQPPIPVASGIRNLEVADDSTVIIIANGKTTYTYDVMDTPDRLLVDFPNVYLLMDNKTITINRGPFIRARFGFHPDDRFTRVVFDLSRPIDFNITDVNNFVTIKVR